MLDVVRQDGVFSWGSKGRKGEGEEEEKNKIHDRLDLYLFINFNFSFDWKTKIPTFMDRLIDEQYIQI